MVRTPKTRRVYVDAKIVDKHDKTLPQTTFVAYIVKNAEGLHGFDEVKVFETDEAEMHAVAFAIRELKSKLERFTILCDHESVVSEVNRKEPRPGETRQVVLEIMRELKANQNIKVKVFAKNPAHRFLNQRVSELRKETIDLQKIAPRNSEQTEHKRS